MRTENFPGMFFEERWVCGYGWEFAQRAFVVDSRLVAAEVDWGHFGGKKVVGTLE